MDYEEIRAKGEALAQKPGGPTPLEVYDLIAEVGQSVVTGVHSSRDRQALTTFSDSEGATGFACPRPRPELDHEEMDVCDLCEQPFLSQQLHLSPCHSLRCEACRYNPLEKDKEDGRWYFWEETWSDRYGPYADRETAERKLAEYCRYLNEGVAFDPEV